MTQDTPDGKTYYCNHADDNSICDACSGRPMKSMRERFDDTFYEEVNSFMGTSFGDSKLDAKLKEFIEQELKKEREEIIEWIEKQDWECFEQTFITKDIINTIKNRYEQSTNRTK